MEACNTEVIGIAKMESFVYSQNLKTNLLWPSDQCVVLCESVDELYGDFEDMETEEKHTAKDMADNDTDTEEEGSDGNEEEQTSNATGRLEFPPLPTNTKYPEIFMYQQMQMKLWQIERRPVFDVA